MGRKCSTDGDVACIKLLFGKPGGKRPLGRLKRRWDDNIKMNLKK
jgi:hypothetical protein